MKTDDWKELMIEATFCVVVIMFFVWLFFC
jgi:hypothetical protein